MCCSGFGSLDTSSTHLVPFYLGMYAEVVLNRSYGNSIISFFEEPWCHFSHNVCINLFFSTRYKDPLSLHLYKIYLLIKVIAALTSVKWHLTVAFGSISMSPTIAGVLRALYPYMSPGHSYALFKNTIFKVLLIFSFLLVFLLLRLRLFKPDFSLAELH